MIQTMYETRRASPMPPRLPARELTRLRKKLLEEQDRRVSEYHRDATAAQSIQEEGVEDLEELASLDLDREYLFARTEEDRETLRLIEEALQRLDEGTYGLCQWSGEPIPLRRLRSIPWARYRADVQAKLETGELKERMLRR